MQIKPCLDDDRQGERLPRPHRLLVSLVVCAYNEAPILQENLTSLCQYMVTIETLYDWEMVFVNDGSTDETGELAEAFARSRDNVRVLHHTTNFGLGQALRFAFDQCRGDYIVTMDIDLSYTPDHIQVLLTRIRESGAKIVVTSPYMKGGSITNVPWLRRSMSIWANRFLSVAAKSRLSTLTGMVRVYDRQFLRGLNLKSMGMEINTEILHKATLLQAQIVEVPARLCWLDQNGTDRRRTSSMRVIRQILFVLLSGFLFRPVLFFIIPGLWFLLLSLYTDFWLLVHIGEAFPTFAHDPLFPDRVNHAVRAAFYEAPHTFVIGGITLMLATQLIGLGILALQSKSYFEELFHLGSSIFRSHRHHIGE